MNRPGTGVVVQDVGKAVTDADGNVVFFAGAVSTVRCCWMTRFCARHWHRSRWGTRHECGGRMAHRTVVC